MSLAVIALAGLSQAKPVTQSDVNVLKHLIHMQELIDRETNNAILQGLEEAVVENDEVTAQYLGKLIKIGGKLVCVPIRSRPTVLEKSIDKFFEKVKQKKRHHRGFKYRLWGFVHRLRRLGRRIGWRIKGFFKKHKKPKFRMIGHGLCISSGHLSD